MNDRQLIDALRRLDVPVTVDPAFADGLFARLQTEVAPRRPSRTLLLLVAALLAAAAAGTAIVGANLRQVPAPLPDARLDGSPGVSTTFTAVQVEATVAELAPRWFGDPERPASIARITWLPAGTEYTLPDGSGFAEGRPVWAAEIVGGEPRRGYLLILADDTLDVINAFDLRPTPSVAPSLPPSITDPTAPLTLTTADGRTISASTIALPDGDELPAVESLRSIGGELWGRVTFPMRGDPGYEFRIDRVTGTLERESFAPALPIDEDGRIMPLPEATFVDEFGRWVPRVSGIDLVDPDTGEVIRRIETREHGNHAFRRIWWPPAFGSLWDLDRQIGAVHRIDPTTGLDIAKIRMGAAVDWQRCGATDLLPVRAVDGLPDVMAAECDGRTVLVDPATNTFLGTVPAGLANATVIDGTWWWFDAPDSGGDDWQEPGRLVAVDPAGGPGQVVLTIGLERTGMWQPVVIGDSLWFLVGERPAPDSLFFLNLRLARISLADLASLVEEASS